MTSEECRQARELLGWSRVDLAKQAGCSAETIKNLEDGRHAPSARTSAIIRTALEAAGVEFIAENGGGAGVRLKKALAGVALETGG